MLLSAVAPLALVALVALVGCGGKERFDGQVYHAERGGFQLGPIPSSWERLRLDGPLLAFADHATGGAVEINAQCGKDADDVPLSALTKHLLIGYTERNFREEKLLPLDGREALHTVVDAKLDGVQVTLDAYVMKKDGCVYDLVYVAKPSTYEAAAAGFAAFVAGFHTVGG